MAVKVGITGGIGSGKTYVCRQLEQMGYDVFYCDDEARRLMAEDSTLRTEITALVGTSAYDDAGNLNKPVLSAFIHKSAEHAEAIDRLVHPLVRRAFREWCAEREAKEYVFMECALMYEAHFDEEVDSVVCVVSPMKLRLERLRRNRGISEQQAREWMQKQMGEEEKASRANIIIYNREGEEPDVKYIFKEINK